MRVLLSRKGSPDVVGQGKQKRLIIDGDKILLEVEPAWSLVWDSLLGRFSSFY